MFEDHSFFTNIEKLVNEIEKSRGYINKVKDQIGDPKSRFEYYGKSDFQIAEGALDRIEEHYFFDQLYFVKMVGLLESLHIHLLSDYIIENEKYKAHVYGKFEVLEHKESLTGFISDNAFTGEEKVRFNSDQGLTEYLSSRFFPGKESVGCLGAISLLNNRTLNDKVYDKLLSESYRSDYVNENFLEIKEAIKERHDVELFFFTESVDFVNLLEVIAEMRNRMVHRFHQYDFSSIVSNKSEKLSNFPRRTSWDDMFPNSPTLEEMHPTKSKKEINLLKEKYREEDSEEIYINAELITYLKSKNLLKESENDKYFAYDDMNLFQFTCQVIDTIILENLYIHQFLYDSFIDREL